MKDPITVEISDTYVSNLVRAIATDDPNSSRNLSTYQTVKLVKKVLIKQIEAFLDAPIMEIYMKEVGDKGESE